VRSGGPGSLRRQHLARLRIAPIAPLLVKPPRHRTVLRHAVSTLIEVGASPIKRSVVAVGAAAASAEQQNTKSAEIATEATVDGRMAHSTPNRGSAKNHGSAARRQLLHRPFVAVWIAEVDERAPGERLDLADIQSALQELGARCLNVRHDELHLSAAGRRIGDADAEHDRTCRARRGELNESKVLAHLVVMVGVKAGFLGVKALGPIHVGDGDGDELQLPVHAAKLSRDGPGG